MQCPNCGQDLIPNAPLCRHCGTPVGAAPPAYQQYQPAPPAQGPPRYMKYRSPGGGGVGPGVAGIVLLLAVAAGYWLFFSDGKDPGKTPGPSGPVATTGTPAPGQPGAQPTPIVAAKQASLGAASFKAPDPGTLVATSEWGQVPAGHFGVVLRDGLKRSDAEALASSLGARIVGEVAFIQLYQLETGGKTEADLRAALSKAKGSTPVELAFPITLAEPDGDIRGQPCAPLSDQTYAGANGIPYKMIGVENAWQIIRASGVELSGVRVGITDDGLYRGKGEFGGLTKFDAPGKDDALSGPLKDSGVEDPTGSHGTAVASVLAADPDNGGIAGVASVLGDKLSVEMTNIYGSEYGTNKPSKPNPKDPTQHTSQGQTYSIGALAAMQKQIDSGATIINASWGASNANTDTAKAYRKFFEKMAKERPDVLFVASAGNDGKSLDGSRRYPSGAALPNMITVGNVENDGSNTVRSNMSGKDFEVTLAAPGEKVPQGRGVDGKTSNEFGGTSLATPQVAAAAAMLRAINPKLTAGDLKKILVDTAATEVDTSGKKVQVDPSIGGRVLRVDNAVLKVVNDVLVAQGKKPVKLEDLQKIESLAVIALGGKTPKDYTIKATVGSFLTKAVDVTIAMSGQGAIGGESRKRVNAPGEVTWGFSLMGDKESASLLIRRLDNGACSRAPGKWLT